MPLSSRASHLTRWDALKFLALLLMFVDHSGHFYYTEEEWLRGIGRACAPIFLFLAGFAPHYKTDVYLLTLALLLNINDWLLTGSANTLNILWSILLARMLLAQLERRQQFKLRLIEWIIGCTILFMTLVIFQYGSIGLLFALSGYVYKHRTHYRTNTPARFLITITVIYGIIFALLSQFSWLSIGVMSLSLIAMISCIHWFTREPRAIIACLPALTHGIQTTIRYTAEIYVIHLIILCWLTGTPF